MKHVVLQGQFWWQIRSGVYMQVVHALMRTSTLFESSNCLCWQMFSVLICSIFPHEMHYASSREHIRNNFFTALAQHMHVLNAFFCCMPSLDHVVCHVRGNCRELCTTRTTSVHTDYVRARWAAHGCEFPRQSLVHVHNKKKIEQFFIFCVCLLTPTHTLVTYECAHKKRQRLPSHVCSRSLAPKNARRRQNKYSPERCTYKYDMDDD